MQKRTKKLFIVLLCVLCFGAGISVPVILGNSSSNSEEQTKFDAIYSILTNKWYYSNKIKNLDEKLMEQAITGMTTLDKDAHTNYLSLENTQAFSSSLEGSNVGIGITFFMNSNKNIQVTNVYVNSTADKKGLLKGDEIVRVGNLVCNENSSDDLVSYIKKYDGKRLELEYVRDGEHKTVMVTPSEFDSTVALDLQEDHAIITLSSFSENSGKDFANAMGRISKAGVSKVIIDLRNNGGGYLSAALDIASSLLPKDSVVFVEKDKDGNETKQMTTDNYSQVKMDKIVVLQNENTASASECLIGALKDNLGDCVTTVGTTSYGKGTEQVSVAFKDGTSFKYTIARWYTPNGTSINKKGFTPDIEVELSDVQTVMYKEMDEEDVIYADGVHVNAKALQLFLAYLGYTTDRSDTYFSLTSSAGLTQYQQDHGLEPTGNCDSATFDQLLSDVSTKLNESKSDDTQLQAALGV